MQESSNEKLCTKNLGYNPNITFCVYGNNEVNRHLQDSAEKLI